MGDVGGQALALGLVDEVAMDVVPVVFGSGKRTSGRSPLSTCSRTPTWSSVATACCICATGPSLTGSGRSTAAFTECR